MSLEAVIEAKRRFYRRITVGQERHIGEALHREGIEILDGFLREIELVRAFFRAYYAGSAPRVVICGINPGRYGAGQTGLPFLDFHTLGHAFLFLEALGDLIERLLVRQVVPRTFEVAPAVEVSSSMSCAVPSSAAIVDAEAKCGSTASPILCPRSPRRKHCRPTWLGSSVTPRQRAHNLCRTRSTRGSGPEKRAGRVRNIV